jgi:hypothetical protein
LPGDHSLSFTLRTLTLAALTSTLAVTLAVPALSQDVMAVRVRVGVHDDFQRVVFDWPYPVAYTEKQQGRELRLHFAARADMDLSRLTPAYIPYVTRAEQVREGDTTVVSLTLQPGIAGRDMHAGPPP